MGRSLKTFNAKEIARVRKLHASGHSNAAIAASLGLTKTQLDRCLRYRKFGNLPKRRGYKPKGYKAKPDDEPNKILFGQTVQEWQAKRDAIRESWPEDEELRRARTILPNRERPPGLRFLKDE